MKKIVESCYPSSKDEAVKLWHDIKPVKFGNRIGWVAGDFSLADYVVPEDAAYMLILRVECYVFTEIAAAPAFGQFSPPPFGSARWLYSDVTLGTVAYNLTPVIPIHLLLDVDEFLFAKGDHSLSLLASLSAPPDANARFIRTLVYAYLVGASIADKLGGGESTYFSALTS